MIRDIFNTYREAFRIWVRSKTRPKTMFEAEEKQLFWSKCYLISATCAVGIYLFQSLKSNAGFGNEKDTPKILQLAKGINQNDSVRIIKYSGFQRVADKTVNTKDLEKDPTLVKEITSAPKVS